jgi:hypothetical protein
MTNNSRFNFTNVRIVTDRYAANDRLAVFLYRGHELYAIASVCIGNPPLAEDEFLFKTYTENEGLMRAMIQHGFIEWTGRCYGCSLGLVPICRLL